MQLLSNESYEFGKRVGLGIISGEVKKIEYHNPHISSINRPTIGWFNTKVSNTSHFMSIKLIINVFIIYILINLFLMISLT